MLQKLIVPVAAIVLAVLAGLAIWFLMQDDGPKPIAAGNEPDTTHERTSTRSQPLKADDFDAAHLNPDPISNQRPEQPFVVPDKTSRVIFSGRVVSEGGGVPDARVMVMDATAGRIIPRANQPTQGLHGSGYTDASGFYRLLAWSTQEPTVQKNVIIAAEAPDGGVALSDPVDVTNLQTYEAADLVIAASSVIEGQVLGLDGQPAPGAEVSVRSAGPVMVATLRGRAPSARKRQYVTTAFADENGNFRFANLPPGLYGLDAYGAYFGVTDKRLEVDVSNSNHAWQEVRLSADGMIRGVLSDQGGLPVPGAVVRLNRRRSENTANPEERPKVTDLKRADFRDAASLRDSNNAVTRFAEVRPFSRTVCVTDSAGRFGFPRPGTGEFDIVSRVGSAEAKLESVTASTDDYQLKVEVKTSIGGIVRDEETGRLIERFDARVIPGDGPTENSPFEVVADNGRFHFHTGGAYSFANPKPGTLRVRVCAPGYAPCVVVVEDVKEGDQRRAIDVPLKPLCRLTARLVRDGRALDLEPCALVFDDRLAYEVSTDELGRMLIPDVTPAVYRVRVVLTDGSALEGAVEVPATHEAGLDINVGPAK